MVAYYKLYRNCTALQSDILTHELTQEEAVASKLRKRWSCEDHLKLMIILSDAKPQKIFCLSIFSLGISMLEVLQMGRDGYTVLLDAQVPGEH